MDLGNWALRPSPKFSIGVKVRIYKIILRKILNNIVTVISLLSTTIIR